MSGIDVEGLLEGVSGEQPCGPNLEYDPNYIELDQVAKGKPARQAGDEESPPEPPAWPEVSTRSLDLLKRSKDLRVAVHLIYALLHTGGLRGAHDGLAVMRGLLERYWDTVHPRLDPDDGNDPTQRVNTIMSLCGHQTMLQYVRTAPLVQSRIMGSFCLRDIEIATGKLVPKDGKLPRIQEIDAAFKECPIDELKDAADAIKRTLDHLAAIEDLVTAKVGAAKAPNFEPLVSLYKECRSIIAGHLRQRVQTVSEEGDDAREPLEISSVAAARPLNGQIRTRDDVIRVLDAVCQFFERSEPSSPVPLLLQRAKGLMSKSFLEILKDLAPDGAKQAEIFRGPEGDKK